MSILVVKVSADLTPESVNLSGQLLLVAVNAWPSAILAGETAWGLLVLLLSDLFVHFSVQLSKLVIVLV